MSEPRKAPLDMPLVWRLTLAVLAVLVAFILTKYFHQ